MDFVSHLATYQKTRDLHITYGKVCLKPATGDGDSTMYIKGDPVTVMFEFTRMKEVDILDLFITFDTDGSHSVTWEEFKEGVQVLKKGNLFLLLNVTIRTLHVSGHRGIQTSLFFFYNCINQARLFLNSMNC